MRGNILVIDDEVEVFEDLQDGIGQAHNIYHAETLTKIRDTFKRNSIDMAIVDLNMKIGDQDRFTGLDYIKRIRERNPSVTIIVLSGYRDIPRIVQAVKNGADHYLYKGNLDTDSHEFRMDVLQWINAKKKLDEKRELNQEELWGELEFPQDIIREGQVLSLSETSFFLIAEPGLGKTKLIHHLFRTSNTFNSKRKPAEIDLSQLRPKELTDFLYLRRGTSQENPFKSAKGKTLVLKNIEKHPLSVQESFIGLLLQKKFLNRKDPFTKQIVFLLNQSPQKLIEKKCLSPELFHAVQHIILPPLRDRVEELSSILEGWLKRNGYKGMIFSRRALTLLKRYPYPGNITELYQHLKATIEAHQTQHRWDWQKRRIEPESLPELFHQTPSFLHEDMEYEVAKVHLRFIEEALKKYAGERRQKDLAAKDLNIKSADNLKKTYIDKYWEWYPDLMVGYPTIMQKYKLNGKKS